MTKPTGDAQTSPPTHDGSTPPLSHAAPAPAADLADARRLASRLSGLRARVEHDNGGSAEWMTDGAGLINAICDRAEAAEAERDRLEASNAELSATLSRLDADWERTCAAVRQEYEAERDRLSAELAAVQVAMPDAGVLEMAAAALDEAVSRVPNIDDGNGHGDAAFGAIYDDLKSAASRIRAALATATPPPPAAVPVTGGGGVDGIDWIIEHYGQVTISQEGVGDVIATCPIWGDGEAMGKGGDIERAIQALRADLSLDYAAELAALDTPQEADHAR